VIGHNSPIVLIWHLVNFLDKRNIQFGIATGTANGGCVGGSSLLKASNCHLILIWNVVDPVWYKGFGRPASLKVLPMAEIAS